MSARVVSLLLILATPAWSGPEVLPERRPLAASAWLGFSHWFGASFGTPDGIVTPTVGVGLSPGVRFAEVRLRYTLSLIPLPQPSGESSPVGFASLEVVGKHEFTVGTQRLGVHAGLLGALVHSTAVSAGIGGVVGARWTFAASQAVSVGLYFEGRVVGFTLPGDTRGLFDGGRRDGQLDAGVVLTLF